MQTFCTMKPAIKIKETKLPFYYCFCGEERRKRAVWRKRFKEFACEIQEIEFAGMKGERIVLPYTSKELMQMEEKLLGERLESFLQERDIGGVVAQGRLQTLLPKEVMIDGRGLKHIFLKEWIDFVIRVNHIPKQKVQLLILADYEKDMESWLFPALKEQNHVIISADRPEEFERLAEQLHQEYGLVVEFLERSCCRECTADICLDCLSDSQSFRLYKERGIVIDLTGSEEKAELVRAKRKRIRFYGKMNILSEGKIYTDAEGAAAFFVQKKEDAGIQNLAEWVKLLDLKMKEENP